MKLTTSSKFLTLAHNSINVVQVTKAYFKWWSAKWMGFPIIVMALPSKSLGHVIRIFKTKRAKDEAMPVGDIRHCSKRDKHLHVS